MPACCRRALLVERRPDDDALGVEELAARLLKILMREAQ
jgi:hypothetical protein